MSLVKYPVANHDQLVEGIPLKIGLTQGLDVDSYVHAHVGEDGWDSLAIAASDNGACGSGSWGSENRQRTKSEGRDDSERLGEEHCRE